MSGATIEQVRSFNRTVTQRIGVLQDEYLARGRPLGASRVLWEVGRAPVDVRALRARLDLDSGYLSRLLRSLERDGLVTVEVADGDRRVRVARLTAAGLAEREELDRRSDAAAAALLEPLDDGRRKRLVAAMAEVEQLFTAGLVRIGHGTDHDSTYYWGLDEPIFANATGGAKWLGDGAWMFDPQGDLRAWYMYPCRAAC